MATPKKEPAKKAAPRTVEKRNADNMSRFAEFRARAQKIREDGSVPDLKPYVVKAAELDDGIDADVVLSPPATLAQRTALDRAIRNSDFVAIVVIMGGEGALNRMVAAFDRVATDVDDASRLFAGFGYSVINHLNGRGAADVPGGTPAS
ncbi:hypothetical protein ACXYTP_23395 [Tsukamurella ocularis]